jgi:quercetin dioxygenase-like cupin family protein
MSQPIVRHADTVPLQTIAAGDHAEMQVLLGEGDGTPHFAMRRFRMGEGGGMPRHTNQVEHEQYVLSGRAKITIDDAVHEVAPGQVLFIPAGVPHSYEVVEGPFEFLCLVPNGPDRIDFV